MSAAVREPLEAARALLLSASELALAEDRSREAVLYLGEAGALARYVERLIIDRAVESVLLWSAADSVERLADRSAAQSWAELDLIDAAAAEIQSAADAVERSGL